MFALLVSQIVFAKQSTVKIPIHCKLHIDQDIQVTDQGKGLYTLTYDAQENFFLRLTITDLFGATITRTIVDADFGYQEFPAGIVSVPYANPVYIDTIPKLCPRVKLIQEGDEKSLVYDAAQDVLNERPSIQMFDPDYEKVPAQGRVLRDFDDKNVLEVLLVKLSYDYEDTAILDYRGPHPLTKKEELVYEGEGGFYANFHYAVVPYDPRFLKLTRQEMLNMVQGRLFDIDRQDLLPSLRAHSFIPGPYLSKKQVYDMCEWGDTAFQSKVQQMAYKGFKIWDWDLGDSKNQTTEKVILVVWEGDEEAWLVSQKLLDPFYLTDDLVGIFVVERKDTLRPLLLKNKGSDFQMVVRTLP